MEHYPTKRVKEATYLTAEKAWSYRAILRYFYIQHERMREFLFSEEIHAYLQRDYAFKKYEMEELHQDLDSLVRWGNLIARQELGKSKTIEEFKKKRFRYQCTPYTVEFERMIIQLEGIGESFGGSLEKKQFERLYQTFLRIERIIIGSHHESDEECAQVWNDALTYFRQITQNTSDYIAYINSEEVEERMQTEAFLIYKDQFTMYLRDFIIALQSTALQTQELLVSITNKELEAFFVQVTRHQQQTFRFNENKEGEGKEENPLQELYEKWSSITSWFLGNEHGESEFVMLELRTNEAIRRMTRIVQRLGERHQHFHSRKKDYMHLAKWFDGIDDIDLAHQLSSVVFGVFHSRHFQGNHVPSEDIYLDVWDEEPMIHETKPRIRNYREKTKAGAIINNQTKKQELKQRYLEEQKREKALIETYINNNEIDMEQLGKVEKSVRKVLLIWIGKAMGKKDRIIKTDFGREVEVVMSRNDNIEVVSEDGVLKMPKVIFRFLN
ncbi:TIGR02677 family protein [Alkalihalobacillus pseudalcaliphilus]|uniref:TIGR02677 family protein n=1 Tax=Alkalihalobacillus pseudalcaliphilus TaxID=79884 RepID=UPI00064DDBE2|nr:TIGR02677 family protein [Alkalihalobacillus pseudalcaliphilus]KMK75185.1 cytosolic protein [Alkalihalobacillus pseudalcaliphilus]